MRFLTPKIIETLMSIWSIIVTFGLKFHFESKIGQNVALNQNCFNKKCSQNVKLIRLYGFLTGGSALATSEHLTKNNAQKVQKMSF